MSILAGKSKQTSDQTKTKIRTVSGFCPAKNVHLRRITREQIIRIQAQKARNRRSEERPAVEQETAYPLGVSRSRNRRESTRGCQNA